MSNTRRFKLFDLLALSTLTIILAVVAISTFISPCGTMRPSPLTGTANTGKKIHVALIAASLNHPGQNIFPTTAPNPAGPLTNAYTNATDYFRDAIDGENLTKPLQRRPIAEIDTNWLSDGVDSYSGTGPLLPKNIAWTIAANIHPNLPGYIPILLTRNLHTGDLELKYDGTDTTKFKLGQDERTSTPLGDSGFVTIRLDGSAETFRANTASIEYLFAGKTFDITGLTVNGQSLKYLTPWETISPKTE